MTQWIFWHDDLLRAVHAMFEHQQRKGQAVLQTKDYHALFVFCEPQPFFHTVVQAKNLTWKDFADVYEQAVVAVERGRKEEDERRKQQLFEFMHWSAKSHEKTRNT